MRKIADLLLRKIEECKLLLTIIKTQYTGNRDSFAKVINAAQGVPVVCAGGPPINVLEVLENAFNIIATGGRGLSFARNIFVRKNPTLLIKTLSEIVHNKASVEEAISRTNFNIHSSNNDIEIY